MECNDEADVESWLLLHWHRYRPRAYDEEQAMNDEPTRTLKQRWDEEDAVRDEQEERAQQAFLEEEANKTFAPIEGFLIRLSKVLSAAGASMEIDTTWEHLGEQGYVAWRK